MDWSSLGEKDKKKKSVESAKPDSTYVALATSNNTFDRKDPLNSIARLMELHQPLEWKNIPPHVTNCLNDILICLRDIKPCITSIQGLTRSIASNNHVRFSDIEHQHGSMRLEMLESIEKHNSLTVAKYEADFCKLREDLKQRDCDHDQKLV